MILTAVQVAYLCNLLKTIDQNWSIMFDQMDQILTIVENIDSRSEQADDRSRYFNERRRSIDNAIVNP